MRRVGLSTLAAFVLCFWDHMPHAQTTSRATASAQRGSATTPAPLTDAAMTNADVVKMAKARLAASIVIAAIQGAEKTDFAVDADALISLKNSGVDDTVIAAMIARKAPPVATSSSSTLPAAAPSRHIDSASTGAGENGHPSVGPDAPRDQGIYVEAADGTLDSVALEPTTFTQGKSGGFLTSALTYGIKKAKWKAIVRSASANRRLTNSLPTFYFYFEQKSSGLSYTGAFAGWMAGASSPNEFVLAKMTQKDRERELIVGEFGLLGSSTGTRSDDTVDLKIEKLSPGRYRVTPASALEAGEYCFFYAAGSAAFGAGTAGKLFDFGVDPLVTGRATSK